MSQVHMYGVYETGWESAEQAANLLWLDAGIVEFRSPTGGLVRVRPFWDGGDTWRVRFSPDEEGDWMWIHRDASGEVAHEGNLSCVPYGGENPLYRHGPLVVAEDRRRLVHADGTPFFWLGDTAWNGVIRGDDSNWARFLEARARQRFSLIQFVCSHWRGDALDEAGEPSCTEEHPIEVNPAFFQRIDRRVAMVNEAGLIAAPVALWSLLETDLGYKLPEEDAVRMASYIVARYDAYQVVWLLGGDGNYQKMGVDRWRRMGRRVFETGHDRLVTLHPCGANWVGEEFRNEEWYDIIGYQSGHGDSDADLVFQTRGPPAAQWRSEPRLPVINLEPNYETAMGYSCRTVFTEYHVRRAAYWSLLVSPTAGLTYGHDAIWNWNFETGPSEGHGNWHDRAVPPWDTGLDTPGIRSMTVMRGILDRLPWTSLDPAQDALAVQPGKDDPARFIAAARAGDGTFVVYAPVGGAVQLAATAQVTRPVRRVDPATGEATVLSETVSAEIDLPEGRDWLLVCGPGWLELG